MSNVFSSLFSVSNKWSKQAIIGGISIEFLRYEIVVASNPVGDARQDDVAPRPEAPDVPCSSAHSALPGSGSPWKLIRQSRCR